MPLVPGGPKPLPVGSVIERRQDGRIWSWDDALDVMNRLLGGLKRTLENINDDMTASNERLTAGLRETGAKIAANQRLLEKIVVGDS